MYLYWVSVSTPATRVLDSRSQLTLPIHDDHFFSLLNYVYSTIAASSKCELQLMHTVGILESFAVTVPPR